MNKEEKIFVAGHKGMVGSSICKKLNESGYKNILTISKLIPEIINLNNLSVYEHHFILCKTHKENSFSKVTEPKKVLFDAFIEIQKLPKIKDKNDPRDIEIFDKFTNFIKIFIPHLMLYSKNETNTINLDDRNADIPIKELHELFKVASKGKRKAMLDQYVKHNCN